MNESVAKEQYDRMVMSLSSRTADYPTQMQTDMDWATAHIFAALTTILEEGTTLSIEEVVILFSYCLARDIQWDLLQNLEDFANGVTPEDTDGSE